MWLHTNQRVRASLGAIKAASSDAAQPSAYLDLVVEGEQCYTRRHRTTVTNTPMSPTRQGSLFLLHASLPWTILV